MSEKTINEVGQIYKIMPKVISAILPIGKDSKNTQQNYNFRGIDSVYNFIQPILAANGLFIRSEIQDIQRSERPSRSGGVMTFVQLRARYYIVAPDSSSVWSDAVGESMDSGDKAVPKAQSVAQKYFFLQMFCIPTEDAKDVENDSPEPAPLPKARPAPRPPADDNGGDHDDIADMAYTGEDKGAPFRTIPLTMSDGKARKYTKFEAYKKFGNMKTVLGEERYYAVLKSGGYAHANEIPDKALPTMYAVLLAKKQQIDEEEGEKA